MDALAGKRVAVVSRIYVPEPAAASYRLRALVAELAANGAAVDVLTSNPPAGFDDVDSPARGARVRRMWVLRDRAGYVRGYLQYLSFDLPVFFRLLFMRKPHLVIVEPPPTTGWFTRIACGIRGIPYLYYAADIWSDAVGSAGYPRHIAVILRGVERWAMSGAAAVVSVSAEFTERIREQFPRAMVTTVGNGVDTTMFSPVGEKIALGVPYLLYAGTASEVHGAQIFLDAFEEVLKTRPDSKLVFIGQGSDFATLAERSKSLPVGAVELRPRMSPEEVASWIRGAVVTLASVHPDGYARAFATKMYASVACGVPVIYAGTGPGADFAAREGIGHAVAYEKEAIAAVMLSVLSDEEPYANRAARSEWAANNISLRAVASRIIGEARRILTR
ncbi:glycosyltransferase involved in cell wall biosynthesis [Salinibacterium amurskyense]|uniref:D-inositol 3-phosphate glycosyltransferase n=2 Tax=Salinibacterium amurskyense TaxID=205941 RepID=A0A2M9D7U0_9MICO|nr:glycosyltransferase family 4 protein [Salinibacterium amurskyense]PJJ81796.1 glycosyltransferase involved in cell wall biosynthesis [Salinibacterium amurskyense]RLQ83767.1 glycosyltransferase [Salinibacterium amurskyense]GHD79260.1 glycosyl transferase [Salinibacterium amurskyense]